MQKIVIAPQTKIAMMGYILIIVAQVAYLMQKPEHAKAFVPMLLSFVVVAAVGLYVTNCTVVGNCQVYAWIVGYLICIIGIFALFTLIYMMMKN
jgi:hypothetical protein